MAPTVSLHEVVEELEALGEESAAYLNRETGELYSIRDEEASVFEDGVDPDDVPEWLDDELPKIREVLESEDWLSLPTRFDIHEWAIMDGFARSIDDTDLRDELLTAIRGRGAFRCFKDAVHRRGIHEDWYRHRTATLGRIAADWLDGHGVAYIDDLGATPAGSGVEQRHPADGPPV
jgi:hypothetical protein